jgi:hypothetical protein
MTDLFAVYPFNDQRRVTVDSASPVPPHPLLPNIFTFLEDLKYQL